MRTGLSTALALADEGAVGGVNMSDGYVYFIQADENGPIKIGTTADDPMRRLNQLQTGNPSALKLLGAIRGNSAQEKQFHAALSEWRLQGEWFEPHPTVLSAIQEALSSTADPINCGGPYCSFCGVCQHDTAVLLASHQVEGVYICEQCIGRSAKAAAEHFMKAATAAVPIPLTEMGYGG